MSTPTPSRLPKYRHYKPKDLAVVRIDGRDYYLGRYDSEESREKYRRLLAEWLARGRVGPDGAPSHAEARASLSVNELILAYVKFADGYYLKDGRPTVEPGNIRLVLRLVRRLYGSAPVGEFGPLALKAVREEMVRAGNCRAEINRRVGRIVRMFKWGVSEELVPPGVHEALRTVAGLRKGRTSAREKPPVKPVPAEDVEAVRPHVCRQVWAMIELQRLTGMRPGEVVIIRTGDLDASGDVWVYAPSRHKTEHHGKDREIYIGPRGQELLGPWLKEDREAFLFSPAEAMRERRELMRSRRRTRVQPSQRDRSKARPRKRPGECYTVASYRRAIQSACRKADVPSWHPHQIRHARGTEIRKLFGLEASRVVLGHEDVRAAQIYAEEDRDKGMEVMRRIG
ncbi:site-specific integrase [Paludisphaera sp.]|uniref:tyrosine-type recombinase/integrase n=1 Tax=Paludisphaera sp. TaxID=2017432 RepID=UPI00301CD60F